MEVGMKTFLAAWLALSLLCGAGGAAAQDLSKPVLLVAKPTLKGPYQQTALIVVPMGDKHIGFILNRSTGRHMASVFPEHAPSKNVQEPIHFGGPEAADALFALLRRDPGQPSIHLFGDLYITANGKSIDRIIEETPNEARYFAGFVGWMPRELAAEIERGFWLVGEPSAADVFRKDPGDAMWHELSRRLGQGAKPPKRPGDQEAARPSPIS
jgi:putative transcriptional regulator